MDEILKSANVLVVDDHGIVRDGVKLRLQGEDGITVVGEADNGHKAVLRAQELRPDIVIMDLIMPVLNGLEATRQILNVLPSTRIIILSAVAQREYVTKVLHVGARGFVVKREGLDVLLRAVRSVMSGGSYFSDEISGMLAESFRQSLEKGVGSFLELRPTLTARELEVLQLVAEGYPNKQIAGVLCISIKTVEKHRQQVMNKLKIHDIAGLTRYAVATHVISVSPILNGDVQHEVLGGMVNGNRIKKLLKKSRIV